MAKLPPAPSCIFCKVIGTAQGGRPFNNLFHLSYSGGVPTSTQLNTVASQVLSAYSTQFAPLMVGQLSVTECTVADLTSDTSAIGSAAATTVGTATGAALSFQAAAVISWTIARRYRGGHPRSYIPGAAVTDMNSLTTWTPTYTGALQTAATAFRASMNALVVGSTSFTMVTVSYFTGKVMRPQGLPFPIIANQVHPRIDTQRRRLGREILA